jgi:hypothetical protein
MGWESKEGWHDFREIWLPSDDPSIGPNVNSSDFDSEGQKLCKAASGSPTSAPAQTVPTTPTDRTLQQDCDAMKWPQPLPSAVGKTLEAFFDDPVLVCLNVAAVTAPDGHDVENDPANQAHRWPGVDGCCESD